MSQRDYYAILDECIARVRRGESTAACLADYPSQAGQLAPDLALTAGLLQLPLLEPTPDAVASGYDKMMAALDDRDKTSPLAGFPALLGNLLSGLGRPQRSFAASALRVAAVALVLLVIAGGFVITAAAGSLPGDALYPVKRTWESARLTLTVNDSSREVLRSKFEKRRREEVQAVQELRRPVAVEFNGVVESMAGDAWQVGELALTITADTQVGSGVAIGQKVAVRALVKEDGSLNALTIRVIEDPRPLSPRATPTYTAQPTRPSRPTENAPARPSPTAQPAEPSPTPTPEKTRPEPTATEQTTDRPTPTSTLAPSVDSVATRTPEPTNTPSANSLATRDSRPTATPAKDAPTPTATATRRTVDVAPPTPTPTAPASRDVVASPTATRGANTGDWLERPP